ncbi:hypothetical protein HK102_009106 [Quaeritorhiza haematococci]|nr:hypothetical protein HK102_009106 [Quaeritorhiza haematococci]
MISHFFKRSPSPGKQVALCPPIVVEEQPLVNPSPEVIIQTNPDGSLIALKDYLASELTTDQQRLFMASTWMYLNHNGVCCIDLEVAMQWMGVVEKKHQKAKLEENCVEGVDYKIILGTSAQNSVGRGRPKQTILLTPDTFKDLCMMAGTPEGKEARQYFRTMETIVKKYVLMQAAFEKQQHQIQLEQQTRLLEQQAAQTRIQLEEQTRALQAKEDELQQQAKELERYKNKTYEPVEKNGYVYVIRTDGGIKVGQTKGPVHDRIKGMQTGNASNIEVLFSFATSNPKLLEKNVHYILNRYRQEPKREFFDCDPDFIKMVISLVGETIDTLKSCYEHISTDALIRKVNENLGQVAPPAPCPPIVVDEQPPVNPSPEVIIQTNPDGSLIALKDYLASELTTDQQRLFMASTWMYLNRQGECCIDLDQALDWMGVVDKQSQTRKLEERFKIGVDFLLGQTPKQTGRGGHNKKTYLLTPECFKGMCMLAQSKKGDEARQYFIAMEDIVKKYVLMQAAFEKQQHWIQLEQQTRLLEQQATEAEAQTRALQQQLERQAKELERYKNKTYKPVEKNGYVYVIRTDGGIKVGQTKGPVHDRIKGMQTGNASNIEVLFSFATRNPKLLEQIVHYILNRYRQEPKREFFDCDPDFIKMVISLAGETIDMLKSCYEHISTNALIRKVNENLGTTISDIPKKSNNAVTNFINDAFEFGAELTIHQKYLRLAYDEWKRETGDTIGAEDNKLKTFYDKMETVLTARQGVKKCEVRMAGVKNPTTGYKGVCLKKEYHNKLVHVPV